MTESKWKRFERVVAAIHAAESKGAKVTWDDLIEGRQFDVTIRFDFGGYKYLTVVECKASSRAVEVGDVDAFVTKSMDVHASKAILVSTSGFQEGCSRVAQKHAVHLMTIADVDSLPPGVLRDELIPATNVYDIKVELDFPIETVAIRDERGQLMHFLRHSVVTSPSTKSRLNQVIELGIKHHWPLSTDEKPVRVTMPMGSMVQFEHADAARPMLACSFKCKIVSVRMLRCPSPDPRLLAKAYRITDVISATERTLAAINIPLGIDTTLIPGRFYDDPALEIYYYCEAINGDVATLWIVESFQHGVLWQAQFTQLTMYANQYIEVKDEAILSRLRKRLFKLIQKS